MRNSCCAPAALTSSALARFGIDAVLGNGGSDAIMLSALQEQHAMSAPSYTSAASYSLTARTIKRDIEKETTLLRASYPSRLYFPDVEFNVHTSRARRRKVDWACVRLSSRCYW
eukprot:m.191017 g.191017  ORF g.191017 m.191017 type:complete len:114 (-) comp18581_c0_seq8:1476-1817(-)